jgi:peptidyl-prolyl cis-trans isomerase C
VAVSGKVPTANRRRNDQNPATFAATVAVPVSEQGKHQVLNTQMKSVLALAALTLLPALSAAPTLAQTPPTAASDAAPVVAIVNGTNITETDVKLAEAEIGDQLKQYPPQVRRRVLIEFLIENQLFAQAAAKQDLRQSPSFKEKMTYWNRRMLRDTYFEEQVRKKISDEEARKFYDDRIKQVKTGTEIKASHILVKTEDLAKEIYEKIAHGADFSEMAGKHSEDPGSKTKGGTLGYFGKGQMVPAFETAAFQLEVGEISLPVKSRFGWHLIKVEDRRERKPPAFEAVKNQIVTALVRQKANELGKQLREGAQISYPGQKPKIGPTIVPDKKN